MRIIVLFFFLLLASTIHSDDWESHDADNDSNQYKVVVWVCDPLDLETKPVANAPDRYLPKRMAMPVFRQGDMITICIAVNKRAFREGVIIAKLTEFTWVGLDAPFQQRAIDNGNLAINGFTSFSSFFSSSSSTPRSLDCTSVDWCSFTSIHYADFYLASGTVRGTGYAELEFERRLGVLGSNNDEYRRLTDDSLASSSFFEILILVDAGDTLESTEGIRNIRKSWIDFSNPLIPTIIFLGIGAILLLPVIIWFYRGHVPRMSSNR